MRACDDDRLAMLDRIEAAGSWTCGLNSGKPAAREHCRTKSGLEQVDLVSKTDQKRITASKLPENWNTCESSVMEMLHMKCFWLQPLKNTEIDHTELLQLGNYTVAAIKKRSKTRNKL